MPLNSCSRMYEVSKVYKGKAGRPVLDIEEVTILLSISVRV